MIASCRECHRDFEWNPGEFRNRNPPKRCRACSTALRRRVETLTGVVVETVPRFAVIQALDGRRFTGRSLELELDVGLRVSFEVDPLDRPPGSFGLPSARFCDSWCR